MVIDKINDSRPVVLGPRTTRWIERRILELEHRRQRAPTMRDHAELASLRKLLKTGGGDD